jgi:hypothetical protein
MTATARKERAMRTDHIPVKDGEFLNWANVLTAYAVGRTDERGISAMRTLEVGALRKLRCG